MELVSFKLVNTRQQSGLTIFFHLNIVLLLQITSTLTFAAASASAGITVLINDFDRCNVNHCTRFETAVAMAFISWFAVSPSFILNFWSLASF